MSLLFWHTQTGYSNKRSQEQRTENISTCTAYLHFKIPKRQACAAQGVSCYRGKLLSEISDSLKQENLSDLATSTQNERVKILLKRNLELRIKTLPSPFAFCYPLPLKLQAKVSKVDETRVHAVRKLIERWNMRNKKKTTRGILKNDWQYV